MKIPIRKLLISILLGIVGFVGSRYSLNFYDPPFSLSIEWCDAMPILAGIAFGGWYALIAAVVGLGAFYPFMLYTNNGWGCVITSILLVITYSALGYFTDVRKKRPVFWNHPLIIYPVVALIYALLFRLLFPIFLSFNPPFWYPTAERFIPTPVLDGIVTKSFFILLVLIILDVYLLKLTPVRKIFGLELKDESRNNNRIVLGTFLGSILLWYVLIVFNRVFIDQTFPRGLTSINDSHEILALVVSLSAGFLIGTVLCGYVESQLKAEDDLVKSKESYRQIFEQAADGIFIVDASGHYLDVNDSGCKLTGYTRQEILQRNTRDLVMEEEYQQSQERVDFLNVGVSSIFERQMRHKNGSKIHVEISARKLADGRLQGMVRDISARKQAEEEVLRYREHLEDLVNDRTAELEIAKKEADAGNQAKSDFLATMSHEIRTPLNGVLINAQLLQQSVLTDKQRNYLANLQISGDSLLTVISEILDFSKIESGKLILEATHFNLDKELARLAGNLANRAYEKGLELVFDTEPGIPEILVGDPSRLGQILLNLVGNAIKFTETGSVVVRSALLGQFAGQVLLQISVLDTGIGIPKEQLPLLFQPFSQADSSTTRKYGGTGLGLSISQRLVQIMGGEIKVESHPGKGSIFTFTLNLGCQAAEESGWFLKIPQLEGQKVLVVVNNSFTQVALKNLLVPFACKASSAHSVERGLEMLAQCAPDEPYKLVFIETRRQTGGLSALDLVRLIKQDPNLKNTLTILLMSNLEMAQVGENHEVEGTLIKPFTRSQLVDILLQAVGRKVPSPLENIPEDQSREKSKQSVFIPATREFETGFSTETLGKLRGEHILLVEDNKITQIAALELLQNMGLMVTLAKNGEEAVEAARDGKFDAILMDIQMPGIDGYQATMQIRKNLGNSGAALPIIAMTANAMKEDRQKALDAGMDDYISKPVNVTTLANILLRWVKPRLTSGVQVPTYANPGSNELPDSLDSIDMPAALSRLGDNKVLYRRLLVMFKSEHANDIEQIRTALEKADIKLARRMAHSLKGVSAQIGAEALREAVMDLETAIADGNTPAYEAGLIQVEGRLNTVISIILGLTQDGKIDY